MNEKNLRFNADVETVKKLALANMEQLMEIAITAKDRHIKEVYGGERGLICLIEGYLEVFTTLSDYETFKANEPFKECCGCQD